MCCSFRLLGMLHNNLSAQKISFCARIWSEGVNKQDKEIVYRERLYNGKSLVNWCLEEI